MPKERLLICDEALQDIVLLDVGPQPLEVVKTLRRIFGGGLWRAQQTVKQASPVLLAGRVGDEVVRKWADPLRDAGAVIDVRPSGTS